MARAAKPKKEAEPEKVDESAWQDWWALRDELGQRLGGRNVTGMSDAEVLDAARKARERKERKS
ncbi:MAG TPA: hypothetical protein VJ400_03875 [Thermoplasmata archaeon]|nr:hypothetical protein [Thermoplasmata archaeon]